MAEQAKIAKTEKQFAEILQQIQQAKQRAFQQVNTVLVELYWNIGDYISKQVTSWGLALHSLCNFFHINIL